MQRPVQILGSLDGILTGVRQLVRTAAPETESIALTDKLGFEGSAKALKGFDRLYPQPSGESSLQQLLVQLADPRPYDLEESRLAEYRRLAARWRDWKLVRAVCASASIAIFDLVASATGSRSPASRSNRPRSRPGG